MIQRTPLAASFALLLALLLSGVVMVDAGHDDGYPSIASGTRAAGFDLDIVNRTYRVDKTTGSQIWDTVRLLDNSRLEIVGATLTVKELICSSKYKNTSIFLDSEGGTGALLSVQQGKINVRADEITIKNSRVSVINTTGIKPASEDGFDSKVLFHSQKKPLIINNTQLKVEGEAGGLGTSQNAGRGGVGDLVLSAEGTYEINVSGCKLEVLGGKGGDTSAVGLISGKGGDASILFTGDKASLRHSTLYCKAEKAGAPGSSSVGNRGGQATITFDVKKDALLFACTIEAENGANSDNSQQSGSNMFFKSKDGSVIWDEGKSGTDLYKTLSKLRGFTVQMFAFKGARLHQVDVGASPPIAFADTGLEIYWWAFVEVTDNYDSPLEGAAINYRMPPDQVLYPPPPTVLKTDERGEIALEMVGLKGSDFVRYVFQAEIEGGAVGGSDQVRFDSNSNLRVPIEVTTITVDLLTDISNPIGGLVRWYGASHTASSDQRMLSIALYVDDIVIGEASDDASEGFPEFSEWSLLWDSTNVKDGSHKLTMIGRDNKFTVVIYKYFVVNQTGVNHEPVMVRVQVKDSLNTTEAKNGEKITVHVDQTRSIIEVTAFIWDKDARSQLLGPGEGKVVVQVDIRLIFLTEDYVLLTKTIGKDEITKINETGGYMVSFQLDANKKPNSDNPFDEGDYRMEILPKDDAGVSALNSSIGFYLVFDFYPRPFLFIDPSIRPEPDPFEDYTGWKLETKKSDTISVSFNLTDSYDYDDPLYPEGASWKSLFYTVTVENEDGEEQPGAPSGNGLAGFKYTFDLTGVDEGAEGKFYLTLKVKDSQGLESEVTYLLRIVHYPPDKPKGIIESLSGIGVGVKWGGLFILFPVLLVLVILGYIGLGMFFMARSRKDRSQKIDLLDRKREEEKAKEGSVIEEEISGTYMKTSQKYLETTGATKGKAEFQKELEAAKVEGLPPPSTAPIPQQEPPSPPAMSPHVTQSVKPTSVRYFRMGGGKEAVLAAYKKILDKAWEDKVLTLDEEAILSKLRKALGISYSDSEAMREKGAEVQNQILDKLVKETPLPQRWKVYDFIKEVAMKDGQISPDEQEMLDELGSVLGLSSKGAPSPPPFATPPAMSGPPPPPAPAMPQMPARPVIPPPPPAPSAPKPPGT